MQTKKLVLGLVGLTVAVTGWALFRPERLWIDQTVSESIAATTTEVLAQGSFHGVAHETHGTATILRTSEGKKVLRLSDFETSNGPDVQVYLVAAPDARDNDTVTNAGFVHVAPLKGNVGDQNYELDPNVDLDKYRSVTIWCRRFGVNFATAPLTLS